MFPEQEERIPVIDRLDLPAEKIGFNHLPPCRLQLKFFQAKGRWSAYLLFSSEKLRQVEEWIESYNPRDVHIGPGIGPRVIRVEFDTLPDELAFLLNTVRVQNISLHPQSVASVILSDTQSTINAFVKTINTSAKVSEHEVRIRESTNRTPPMPVNVTPRQTEALSLAVALGYYEVPHRVGLREIAVKMDMSLGALSGLLRRAESSVLHSYVDHTLKTEWGKVEQQFEENRQAQPNEPAQAPRDPF